MWNLLYTIKRSDVVEGIDTWGKTSVKAEDLLVNQGGKGEIIEEISEVLPYVGVAVLSETFVIKTVDLRDPTGFVVATEDCDSLGVSNFESNEQGNSLDGVVSSINVIPHEKVVGIWIWTTDSEKLHQIVKLAVNITADCDRAFHWLNVGLIL